MNLLSMAMVRRMADRLQTAAAAAAAALSSRMHYLCRLYTAARRRACAVAPSASQQAAYRHSIEHLLFIPLEARRQRGAL